MKLRKTEINKILNQDSPSLAKRFFAFIIDIIIINLVIVYPFNSLINTKTILTDVTINFNTVLVLFVIALLTVIYFAVFEFYFEQTIGKLIFKIKVISRTGKPSFMQIFNRNISKISFIVLILDCLYLFKKTGQRYLDKLTNTMVVNKNEI
ncbi:MAG: RDD family protein [Candidatus Nanoarchaeia archaeon]|nr:RDD family protein [Candidatus Nanoarchaeia archaeon]